MDIFSPFIPLVKGAVNKKVQEWRHCLTVTQFLSLFYKRKFGFRDKSEPDNIKTDKFY